MGAFFAKLDRGLARAEAGFIAVALAAMVLVVFGDFVLREAADRGWAWAKELAAYLMVWVGFLGASLATHRRRHLVMSLSERLFRPKLRKWTSLAACLITAAACAVLAWLGVRYLLETRAMDERSLTLGVPVWTVQIVIPLAFALIALRFLGTAVRILLHGPVSLGDSGPAPAGADAEVPEPGRSGGA